ncbi:MAG: GNAT family N-acetyltransferase [Pseudomonadota bacterium]
MIQIREMQVNDATSVSELYTASWKRTYGALYDEAGLAAEIAKRFSPEKQTAEAGNPDIITLVAVNEGKIIGASSSEMDERHQAWIDRMHILPEYFGTGLADDLIRATLAKHTGLQSIALKVLKGNDRAIAFYEKHGFAITDEIESDGQVGGAASIVMSRTIPRG